MSSLFRVLFSRGFVELGIFSAVVNVLLLVLPLYMLQIYDRVLPSSSMNTLVYLSLLALGALLVLGLLEVIRSAYANRVAARLDVQFGVPAFNAAMKGPNASLGDVQPLRDLATLRGFIASRAIFFLFDLPFGPLFIALLYLIHPTLFWVTVLGAVLMIAVALLNQAASARSGRQAAENLTGAMNSAQTFARNYETVRALGMTTAVTEFWGTRFSQALEASDKLASVNAIYGGIARTIRQALQMAVLGVGAYLVLGYEMTAGMIFASSMISGRALQPLDQIVGSWRQIIDAWASWKRLGKAAQMEQEATTQRDDIELPAPKGALTVDQVNYFLPHAGEGALPFIKRVSFAVDAGESVAIIGPSQAGKSTLARLIVGAIQPRTGAVRLDGADIRNRDPEELGRHVGYLSQEVELFPGTIGQNIARFDPDATDEAIVAAAQKAQVHDMILRLKHGYATGIGPAGVRLSGGERQRIGLARAFYGDPMLIVLDEPNANLDAEGEAALERAVAAAKQRKATVLLITHRPSIAAKCDRVMILRDGQIDLYGPAQAVLERLAQGQAAAARPAQPAPPQQPAAVVPFGTAVASRSEQK